MISVRVQPFRLLTKAEAAHYCRRSVKKFEAQCPVPPIEMADGDRLWDVRDLDQWIDSLKNDNVDRPSEAGYTWPPDRRISIESDFRRPRSPDPLRLPTLP